MKIHRDALLLCLAAALVSGASLFAVAARSDGPSDHELARQALQRGEVLPLRTVLDQVERDYGGQVLKIEFDREDGRFIYEIRVLQSDGRMIKLEIDAKNGQVIKVKRKDRHEDDD